jgi:RNA polymerase sigma factor (sigma-70 family)
VSHAGFDPAALGERKRHLEQRLAAALRRIDDARVIARVAQPLTAGDAADLFGLFAHQDSRVITAAHECAMLRFAYIVALVAESYGFDAYGRDDLVQRTFLNLPRVVARSLSSGIAIPNPEGWLRRRAQLIAKQMLREELGTAVRNRSTGESERDDAGRLVRTRGTRVSIEQVDDVASGDAAGALNGAAGPADAGLLDAALRILGDEHPLWAEVLRLHYFEGYRLDEVAEQVGRSHGTVRNDALKARARLEAIIRERYPDLTPPGDTGAGRTDVAR